MTLEIHPEAVDEFEQAARYYAERQPGLDQRFIACVDSALRRVAGEPERWPLFMSTFGCALFQVTGGPLPPDHQTAYEQHQRTDW